MTPFDNVGGANIFSTALSLASLAFPQLQLASALVGTLSQAFSSGLGKGVDQALQEAGFPKFLAEAVKTALADTFGAQRPSAEDNQAAAGVLGEDFAQKFADQATKGFVEGMGAQAEQYSEGSGRSGKSAGAKSWLRALAEVLGNIANKAADDLKTMGQNIQDSDPKALTDYQAATQEFSMLMNTFTNAIKTIGEGNANAVRKG